MVWGVSLFLLCPLPLCAQEGGGFSIFDSGADENIENSVEASEPPVVSPNEAFTNPLKQPTIEQLGGEAGTRRNLARPNGSAAMPKLDGSKAIGQYSRKVRDGQSMFANPPRKIRSDVGNPIPVSSSEQGNLRSIAANGLRDEKEFSRDRSTELTSNSPAKISSDVKISSDGPQVDEHDVKFQNSTRRLGVATDSQPVSTGGAPKIAQTTFQDGGGYSRGTGTFGQRSGTSENQGELSPAATRQFDQGAFRNGQRSFAPANQRASERPSIQTSGSTFGNRGSSVAPIRPTTQGSFPRPLAPQGSPPVNRVASLTTPLQQNNASRPQQPRSSSPRNAGSAKELLETWVGTKQDTQSLTGKTLTLKNLLAPADQWIAQNRDQSVLADVSGPRKTQNRTGKCEMANDGFCERSTSGPRNAQRRETVDGRKGARNQHTIVASPSRVAGVAAKHARQQRQTDCCTTVKYSMGGRPEDQLRAVSQSRNGAKQVQRN